MTYNDRVMQSFYRKVQIKAVKSFIFLDQKLQPLPVTLLRFSRPPLSLSIIFSVSFSFIFPSLNGGDFLCFQTAATLFCRPFSFLFERRRNYARYGRLIMKTRTACSAVSLPAMLFRFTDSRIFSDLRRRYSSDDGAFISISKPLGLPLINEISRGIRAIRPPNNAQQHRANYAFRMFSSLFCLINLKTLLARRFRFTTRTAC